MRRLAAVALCSAAAVAAGCGSGGDEPPAGGGTLIDAEDQIPPILNVMLADGATVPAQRILSNVLQNLLTADDSGAYTPQLAAEVPGGDDVREGPLRVTFRLRPEASWSDGRPVTSADVVFTWRTMTDPANQVASRAGWEEIRAIRPGVTATGERCPRATCFTVAFRGDYAPWRDVFSVASGAYVLPRHALAGEDFNTAWNEGGVLGSGPFTLTGYTPRQRAVLQRDPEWWGTEEAGGGPFIDRLVFTFYDGPAAAIAALREGEAQIVSPGPDPALFRRAARIEGVELQSVPSLFFEHIALNTAAGPLRDARVRRALALAIDRKQITEVLLDGTVEPLQSIVRPQQLGHTPAFERYGHDPGAAAGLLERAGWRRGADGVFARGGRPLEIRLVYPNEGDLRRTTARLIAEQAAAAGIRVVPRGQSSDRLYGETLGAGSFDAAMFATGGPVDPSVTAVLASDAVPSEENGFAGQNVYRWTEPAADRLMRLSDRQVDDEARTATLARLQDLIAEQVPLIPLYQQPNTVAHVAALEGVRQNPTQAEVFWNSGVWSLG
ncbi:peptide ABC transporter substrate-binding protein [Miltoncostaea marina]|uniref:peptide ABC transporter substrate-binding protein n=1 Tax=Miltoncostaea marina TaxID=2843215 RepID=UPI001C3E792A|nr:peptide ABC transporter substrate-binding protein [Miltoncostaea marina]